MGKEFIDKTIYIIIILTCLILFYVYYKQVLSLKIEGTENQVYVYKDEQNNKTVLALPQDIDKEATPKFDGIKLNDPSLNFSIQLKGSSSIQNSNITYHLPNEIGNVGQVIALSQVMGNTGEMIWADKDAILGIISVENGGTGKSSLVDNRVLTGGTTINDEVNLTFDGSTLDVNGDIKIKTSGKLKVNTTNIIEDVSGNTWLKNIDSIDTTTRNTIASSMFFEISDLFGELICNSVYVQMPGLAILGTIVEGYWSGTAIDSLYGGTGFTSYTEGQILIGKNDGLLAKKLIQGTTNQIYIDYATAHSNVTFSLPQDIHKQATPRFRGVELVDPDLGEEDKFIRVLPHNHVTSGYELELPSDVGTVGQYLQVVDALSGRSTLKFTNLIGTTNQVSVNFSDPNMTISLPQDIALTSTPNFRGIKLTNVANTGDITLLPSSTSTESYSLEFPASIPLTDYKILKISNITGSVIKLDFVDPITTLGTLSIGSGGTGQTSHTSNAILLGNGVDGILSSSSLTYSSSIFNMAASSKLAIGNINIIDDTSGTTTLSNIDAFDSTTISTISTSLLSSIRLKDSSTNYFQFNAASSMSGNVVCTLPSSVGSVGQGLVVTSASGSNATLSFGIPTYFTYVTITSNTTLADKTIYMCNTSGGAFTVTLPTSSTVGTTIVIIDANGTFGTNNLVLNTGGSDVMYINNTSTSRTSLAISYVNCKISCDYVSTNKWNINYNTSNGIKIAYIYDVKAKNAVGGAISGWTTRVLNTEYDPDNLVTISSNTFTITQPGRYTIEGSSPGCNTGRFRVILVDGNGAVAAQGSSEFNYGSGYYAQTRSFFGINVTLTTSQTYSILIKSQNVTSDTEILGVESNFNDPFSNAISELYTMVKVTKYDDIVEAGVVSLLTVYTKQTITVSDNNTTLTSNKIYICDTSGGAFNVNLPTSPVVGDYIEFIDAYSNFGTSYLTVTAAGNYLYVNSNTSAKTSVIFNQTNSVVKFKYASTNKWLIEAPLQLGNKLAIIREERVANTQAGTVAANTWFDRTLNVKYDPWSIVTLPGVTLSLLSPGGGYGDRSSSNKTFTLQVGTYRIFAKAPHALGDRARIGLYYSGTNTLVMLGLNAWTNNGGYYSQTYCFLSGILQLTTATSYVIKQYVLSANGGTNAAGIEIGNRYDATGAGTYLPEIYTEVEITKIDEPTSTNVSSLAPSSYINKVSVTGTTSLVSMTYYYISSAGVYNLTLPASPALGDIIEIIDGSGGIASSSPSIVRSGSQVIYTGDGSQTSFTMSINGMRCILEYTGSNRWNMSVSTNDGVWNSGYTMSITGSTTNPAKGTVSIDNCKYTVIGKTMYIRYDFYTTGAGSNGSGTYLFNLPSGFTANYISSSAKINIVGTGFVNDYAVSGESVYAVLYSATQIALRLSSNTSNYVGSSNYSLSTTSVSYSFTCNISLA